MTGYWAITNRADPAAARLADRHYSRKTIGSRQFTPPGKILVLVSPAYDALWCTSFPIADYVLHAWAGAWMNTLFRREGGPLASELIREAVAVTRWRFGDPPPLGMITLIDQRKIKAKQHPGYCYLKAGFSHVGETKGGLLVFQLLPDAMPEPLEPLGAQLVLPE